MNLIGGAGIYLYKNKMVAFIAEETRLFLKSLSENIAYISAIIGALAAIYKFIIMKVFSRLKDSARARKELAEKIDKIYYEMTPNCGGSIKDSMRRLEVKFNEMDGKIDLLQGIQNALEEDSEVGVFKCDQDGKNFYVNRTYSQWLGVSKGDLIGYGWRNYLDSFSERDSYDEDWKQAFKEGREVKIPAALKRDDGGTFKCDIRAYPILDKNKNVISYLGIIYKKHDAKIVACAI